MYEMKRNEQAPETPDMQKANDETLEDNVSKNAKLLKDHNIRFDPQKGWVCTVLNQDPEVNEKIIKLFEDRKLPTPPMATFHVGLRILGNNFRILDEALEVRNMTSSDFPRISLIVLPTEKFKKELEKTLEPGAKHRRRVHPLLYYDAATYSLLKTEHFEERFKELVNPLWLHEQDAFNEIRKRMGDEGQLSWKEMYAIFERDVGSDYLGRSANTPVTRRLIKRFNDMLKKFVGYVFEEHDAGFNANA